jgi:hypothetical protein
MQVGMQHSLVALGYTGKRQLATHHGRGQLFIRSWQRPMLGLLLSSLHAGARLVRVLSKSNQHSTALLFAALKVRHAMTIRRLVRAMMVSLGAGGQDISLTARHLNCLTGHH